MSHSADVKRAWSKVLNHLIVGIVVLASLPLGAPGFVANLGFVERGVEESLEWAAPADRVVEVIQPIVEELVEEPEVTEPTRQEASSVADTGDLTFTERARLAAERAQAAAAGALEVTRERAAATAQATRDMAASTMDATTGMADELAYRTQQAAYSAALVTTKALAKFIVWALTFVGLLGWGILELRWTITSLLSATATTAIAGVNAVRGT